MYQQFFSLNKQPFSIAPDPDFLFFTDQHQEALAHLTYGLQGNGGFVVLTGEVGTGKTTICRFLLQDMPADTDIASISNPALSEIQLLAAICDQFSIQYDHENITLKVMFDALASWMLSNHLRGRHAIVLIDEAQHLSFNVLEQLRLLTNIETDNQKPLQIILIGQTELQTILLTVPLRQLSQRITARYHLLPLDKQETAFYIQHRLNIAGSKEHIFEPKAMPLIYKASRGIPRLINQISDRSLLTAYTQVALKVTPEIVKKAIREAELPARRNPFSPYIPHLISIMLVVVIGLLINSQGSALMAVFQSSEQESMQNEWLKVIDSVNAETNLTVIGAAGENEKNTDIPLTAVGTLLAMPSGSYTLQLAALPNQKSLNTFFVQHPDLKGKAYAYYSVSNSNKLKYVVLLGTFNTYRSAKNASKELTKRFSGISPWIKQYNSVHNDIK